jgi:hypothetical protein
MAIRPLPARVAALAVFDDPTRRAVFDLVTRAGRAISRDQAAQALGSAGGSPPCTSTRSPIRG